MKSLLRSVMVGLVPAAILAGCASLPVGVNQTKATAPAPLGLSIGYDLGFLRVDLKRATHDELRFIREPDGSGVMTLQPRYVPVDNPYHHLVVDFGNGLIMDSNGNLTLDLLRLYHLGAARSFDITERFNNLLPAGAHLIKKGNSFERRGTGILVERLKAYTEGRVVQIDDGPALRHSRIVQSPGAISYEPSGRRDWRTVSVLQPSNNSAVFRSSGRETKFTLVDPKLLRSNRGLEISRNGGRIDMVIRSPGGIVGSFVFEKTHTGCTITGSGGYGTLQVMREGNKIYVTKNGSLTETVTVG